MSTEMVCANCSQTFYCYPSEAEKGRKYCSLACRSAHRFKTETPAASRTAVDFTCKHCNKPFVMMLAYLTAYRKKFKHNPLYCSRDCAITGKREETEARTKFICVHCGKEKSNRRKPGGRIYTQQKFCDQICKSEHQKRVALDHFEKGDFKRHTKRGGYIAISIPTLVTGRRNYILEHRYVMSKHIGRDLMAEETVHHINGDRQDNRLENLELFSNRHGPGQRVVDKIAFAIEMLQLYPEFAREAGVELRNICDSK